MTASPATVVNVLDTLDEKHISSSLMFEAMHISAVLTMDAGPYRRVDGSIDRDRVVATVRASLVDVPEWRLVLAHAPLGLTAPAWVPDPDFDIERHVYFADEAVEAVEGRTLRRLTWADRGPLPRDRPLWDITFTPLGGGKLALGARMHHVMGDGAWAFDVVRRLLPTEPRTVSGAETLPPVGRPPRTVLAIPVAAARRFVAGRVSVRDAWREYWRKPLIKRVKRVGGRNIRGLKEIWIRKRNLRATYLPPTRAAVIGVDASRAVRIAAKLRGSLTDLLVSAAMNSVDDDDRGIDVLVPISRRRSGGMDVRNHISMARVHAARGSTLSERVASVSAAMRAALRGSNPAEPANGRLIGYATVMHMSDEPLWFGASAVEDVAILPVGDPRDELSLFGNVYCGRLAVTAISRAELDVDRAADRIRAILESPVGVAPTMATSLTEGTAR